MILYLAPSDATTGENVRQTDGQKKEIQLRVSIPT